METTIMDYMGGCQNSGPFLGTLNIRCRIIIGIQKGTNILTTTHMVISQNRGTHHKPQNTIVLVMGPPRNGTPNCGKLPHLTVKPK